MFSVIIIFKARLILELGNTLGLGPSESSLASDEALRTEIPALELEEEMSRKLPLVEIGCRPVLEA